MASTATDRLPAWKRLGLKLKNDNQSGDAVPPFQASQSPSQSQVNGDFDGYYQGSSSTSSIPKAGNDGNSRLGKRKFDTIPADPESQPSKKSKSFDAQETNTRALRQFEPSLLKREGGEANTDSAPSEEKPRSKGDPNYRKKKSKTSLNGGSSKTRNDYSQDSSEPTAPQNRGGSFTQSLTAEAEPSDTLRVSTETNDIEGDSSDLTTSTKNLSEIARKSSFSPDFQDLPAQKASATLSSSVIRRKSVTFTPDTKTSDGNSASALFKSWATDQKGTAADFTAAEIAEFTPPPKLHPANNIAAPRSDSTLSQKPAKLKEKIIQVEKKKKKPDSPGPSEETKFSKSPLQQSKSTKNPVSYLSYLSTYQTSRDNWKFNKAKQSDILKNALDVSLIPLEYSAALNEYIKGLQGAAARDRLREAATTLLKTLDAESKGMDDPAARTAAHDEALSNRLQKEKKRRREEAEVEALAASSDPETHMRSLKRRRAEDLLQALAFGSTITPVLAPTPVLTARNTIVEESPMSSKQKPRARKRRITTSDDDSSSESSSSSSSDESSSISEGESADAANSDSSEESSVQSSSSEFDESSSSDSSSEGHSESSSEEDGDGDDSSSDSDSD